MTEFSSSKEIWRLRKKDVSQVPNDEDRKQNAPILVRDVGDLSDGETVLAKLLGRMNVQPRVGRLARKSSERKSKDSEIVGSDLCLILEEDDAILGDCGRDRLS